MTKQIRVWTDEFAQNDNEAYQVSLSNVGDDDSDPEILSAHSTHGEAWNQAQREADYRGLGVLDEIDGETYTGRPCDDCGKVLSETERERNRSENEDQDGNAMWCDSCAEEHTHDGE